MELTSHAPDPTEIYRLAAALLSIVLYCAFAAVYVGRREPGSVALAWTAAMALVLAILGGGRMHEIGLGWPLFAGLVIVMLGVPCAASAAVLWRMQRGRTPWRPAVAVAAMVGLLVLILLTWGSIAAMIAGYLL